MGAEVFHHLKKWLHDQGMGGGVGDEGGFAPDLELQRGGARGADEGHRGRGLHARRRPRDRARPRDQRDLRRRRATSSSTRAASCRPTRWRATGPTSARAIRSCRSRTAWTRRTGTAGRALTELARRPRPARRRRPLRHQHRAPEARDRARRRQLDPDQGQPDRHADGDARGDRDGARGRLHGGHVAPLGRDGGHDDRRPRRRHRLRADQDRRALALGPRREVQPAAAHRGGAGRPTRSTRGGLCSVRNVAWQARP